MHADMPFEDVPLVLPHELAPGVIRLVAPWMILALISGRATLRDVGHGEIEIDEIRIDPPILGAAPFTLYRPYNTRSPDATEAARGSIWRMLEFSILAATRDRARDILDAVGSDGGADDAWKMRA